MEHEQLTQILEAAILAVGCPLPIAEMEKLFTEEEAVTRDAIKSALNALSAACVTRGVELREVASGYQFRSKQNLNGWLKKLWEERPARYSRAFLETLALIAYKQPITRGEIEAVRGVAVNTHIIRTLIEREWIKVVGHKEVPGQPALYATTKQFLDYFNLKTLNELPALEDLCDLEEVEKKFGEQLQLDIESQEISS